MTGSRYMLNRRTFTAMLAGAAPLFSINRLRADDYPNKPIQVIVPFSPGAGTDLLSRSFAKFMQDRLNVPVTVINKPGGGSVIGHRAFLDAPHDGYNLLVTTMMPNLINTMLFADGGYGIKDFKFINAQTRHGFMVATSKKSGYDTFGKLVQDIIKQPGKVSSGQNLNSGGHFATVMLLHTLNLKQDAIKLATYGGGGAQSRLAMSAGQVDFTLASTNALDDIAEFSHFVAQIAPEPIPGYEHVPMINDVLAKENLPLMPESVIGVQVYQGVATHPKFATEYPERYEKIISTYKDILQSAEYIEHVKTSRHLQNLWYGPEKTTEIMEAGYDVLKTYAHLMKSDK